MTLVPAREGQVLMEFVPYVRLEMLLRDGATEEKHITSWFSPPNQEKGLLETALPCREFLGLLISIFSCVCTCNE
jgi:hypothetical protein